MLVIDVSVTLTLRSEQREILERLTERSSRDPELAHKADLILWCAEGFTLADIAYDFEVEPEYVLDVRARWLRDGVRALFKAAHWN